MGLPDPTPRLIFFFTPKLTSKKWTPGWDPLGPPGGGWENPLLPLDLKKNPWSSDEGTGWKAEWGGSGRLDLPEPLRGGVRVVGGWVSRKMCWWVLARQKVPPPQRIIMSMHGPYHHCARKMCKMLKKAQKGPTIVVSSFQKVGKNEPKNFLLVMQIRHGGFDFTDIRCGCTGCRIAVPQICDCGSDFHNAILPLFRWRRIFCFGGPGPPPWSEGVRGGGRKGGWVFEGGFVPQTLSS